MNRTHLQDLKRELANLRTQILSLQSTITSAERALEMATTGGSNRSRNPKPIRPHSRIRKTRFGFSMIGAQPGTILHFKRDESITCEVVSEATVKCRGKGKPISIQKAADRAIRSLGGKKTGTGTAYWLLNGIPLNELREQQESGNEG